MDLQPERGRARTAADGAFLASITGFSHGIKNSTGAETDTFHDGTEDMMRFMRQRQSDDCTTRQGIGIGRAVALKMILHQKPFSARLQRSRLGVERFHV